MSSWALVGSPNSGKTTLYNWLTGAKSKTVNYPGSTVEYNTGALRDALAERIKNTQVKVIDTPGVYSLQPQSEDEKVTHDVLFNSKNSLEKIDVVAVVADATQLERHLCIARQVKKSGYPMVLIVTMRDLIEKEKSVVDLQILKNELACDVILFDGILGHGLDDVLQALNKKREANHVAFSEWTTADQSDALLWAKKINAKTIVKRQGEKSIQSFSNTVDKFLLHPFFGFFFFFMIMTLLFASIYWLATPFMDQIDAATSFLADFAVQKIPGLAGEFVGSGFISAVGGVVIFVPQIFILFLGIGLLESSGYLARVAALVDKPLTWVGLGGRSFVPLLSGFACAIPGIMATRNITSKKEKLIAQAVIPFMTCSARLPVYALMIGFLYGDENPLMAGFIMSLLYFGAILVGAIAARIISFFVKDKSKPRLLMELPYYRRPLMSVLFLQAFTKAKSFLTKAGPVIFLLALVLWFATNFPRNIIADGGEASQIAQHSYAAQVGQMIEPVFKPMGLDWRVGFGLISAFAAREVFVSALVLMFNVQGDDEATQTQGLIENMKNASFADGTKIFTTASVAGILIFFMIALQCASTVGILKKEMGSWKLAIMHLVLSNMAAYVLAVIVVATLKSFGL